MPDLFYTPEPEPKADLIDRLLRMADTDNGSTADYPEDWFDQTEQEQEEFGEPWSPVPKYQPGDEVSYRGNQGSGTILEVEQFEGGWWYRVKNSDGSGNVQAPEEALYRPEGYDQPGETTMNDWIGIPPEAEQYYRTAAVGEWYLPVKDHVEQEAKYFRHCPSCGGYLEKRGEDVYTCQTCPYELPEGGERKTAAGEDRPVFVLNAAGQIFWGNNQPHDAIPADDWHQEAVELARGEIDPADEHPRLAIFPDPEQHGWTVDQIVDRVKRDVRDKGFGDIQFDVSYYNKGQFDRFLAKTAGEDAWGDMFQTPDPKIEKDPKWPTYGRPFPFIYSPTTKQIHWGSQAGLHREIENHLYQNGQRVQPEDIFGRWFPLNDAHYQNVGNDLEIYEEGRFHSLPWSEQERIANLIRLNAPR